MSGALNALLNRSLNGNPSGAMELLAEPSYQECDDELIRYNTRFTMTAVSDALDSCLALSEDHDMCVFSKGVWGDVAGQFESASMKNGASIKNIIWGRESSVAASVISATDSSLIEYDLVNQVEIWKLQVDRVKGVITAIAHEGDIVGYSTKLGSFSLYDQRQPSPIFSWKKAQRLNDSSATAIGAMAIRGPTMATAGSSDGLIRLWDIRANSQTPLTTIERTPNTYKGQGVGSLHYLNNSHLVFVRKGGEVGLFSLPLCAMTRRLALYAAKSPLRISHLNENQEKLFLAGGSDTFVVDAQLNNLSSTIHLESSSATNITGLGVTSDALSIAAFDSDRFVRVWHQCEPSIRQRSVKNSHTVAIHLSPRKRCRVS